MLDDLKISLPLYEGPLDLLLDLIRREKLDIYDIPIAKITEQYLAYLHLMEELNVDLASEFLVIAAQLIYIKSRMLLPPDPDMSPEEEDPRAELIRRLLEYEKFKNAAQMLYQRELVEQMMAFLFEKIVAAPGAVALSRVLPEIASRRALITAFLAVLELTRLHAIYLKQDKAFGEITARANPNYELSKSFSPA